MSLLDWEKLLIRERFKETPSDEGLEGRSTFQKDFDRIAFSYAFRRLQGKTQVHPIPHNDHVHNRLTHSIETASIGRTLGTKIGLILEKKEALPQGTTPLDIGSIVQAACLAHDIGNPPFGHAGEYAIREWFSSNKLKIKDDLASSEFSDISTFEGNAQGFRVITRLENHFCDGGMRLSLPTLGAYLKYPWTSSNIPDGKEKNFLAIIQRLNI